jgi:putative colanic acid biosynthesis UDP-glucose lipid carrier transferase
MATAQDLTFKRPFELELLRGLADVMILALAAHIASLICFDLALNATEPVYTVLLLLSCCLAFFMFPQSGMYVSWRGRFMPFMLWRLASAWGLILLIALAFTFVIDHIGELSRRWLLYWYLIGIALLTIYRIIVYFTLRFLRRKGYNTKRVVIIGYGQTGQEMHQRALQLDGYGYDVVAIYANRDEAPIPSAPAVVRLETLEQIPDFVTTQQIQEVWITLPLSASASLLDLQFLLRNALVDIRWVPDTVGLHMLSSHMVDFLGLPTVDLNRPISHGLRGVLKHFLDKVFAATVLVMLAPLFAFVAIGIKYSSPGPVFFKQARLGLNGKQFMVYKFRSMQIHQENGKVAQATQGDVRITGFGQFLRRTSIDELPQFLNVLLGDMSVIGPRPHAMQHNAMYEELLDMYMARHRVKPGITGWAQIHGLRGETDTLDKMKKRVQFDLHYIQNWSLLMDFRILAWTTFNGWTGKNAY